MTSKEYFESKGISVKDMYLKSELTASFLELIKKVEKADIPEGDMSTPGTKDYFRYKIGFCVSCMDESEILDGNMLEAWTKEVEKLPVKPVKYLAEEEEKTFQTRAQLQDYLDFRKNNDVWVFPDINECSCMGFDVHTDISEETRRNFVDDIVTEDIIHDTLESKNRLVLVFPRDFKLQVMPIRYTAFEDVCQRARLFGGTMEMTQDKGNIKALPAVIKGQWFSTAFSLNGESCKILIRDEKVNSMKSQRYVIFPESDLIERLEAEISSEWSDYRFERGFVSHEYLSVDYAINDKTMEDAFRIMLEELSDATFGDIKAGINLTTSDIGASSVMVSPYYIMGGMRMQLGERIRIRHDNGNTLDDFSEAIKGIASSFREGEEQVEKLGNQEISHPADCFSNIVSAFKLPKNVSVPIEDGLRSQYVDGSTCNAIDIYLSLNEIVDRYNITKKPSLKELITLSENIAKLLYIDYTTYDHLKDV